MHEGGSEERPKGRGKSKVIWGGKVRKRKGKRKVHGWSHGRGKESPWKQRVSRPQSPPEGKIRKKAHQPPISPKLLLNTFSSIH